MRPTTSVTATASAGQSFGDNIKAWQDNPFEGPTRNSYVFGDEDQTKDYLGQLEANDVRDLKQNDGTFAGSITPSAS